jgi:hypothetical protein
MPGPRTNPHHHKNGEASPTHPRPSAEHQPVQQTLSARHRTLPEVAVFIFHGFMFRTGIHASKLPDLLSTAPRRQTAATSLRSSIFIHPPPSPRYATPLKLTTADVVEETPPHHTNNPHVHVDAYLQD